MDNRTYVRFLGAVNQEVFKAGDFGYIDGYVRGGDDRPNAVVVRLKDGAIGFAPLGLLIAVNRQTAEAANYG